MKKVLVIALVLVSLFTLFIPGTAQAQAGLTVSPSLVTVSFPDNILLAISARSDVDITDIRVHYTVEHQSFATVIAEAKVAFIPAKEVTTQWAWDMRRTGALPPGARVTYWLTVKDSSGAEVETLPSVVKFDDVRFDWNTLEEGQVTLFWYDGDEAFAADLMATAQAALSRMLENTGAELETDVALYIYGSTADLQSSLITTTDWTGGVAYSQYGTIAIGIDPEADLSWGKRTIAHELTHLVTYQVTANPYNSLPTWLNEGLSVFSEGELSLTFAGALAAAEANGLFFSVRSLCSSFSAFTDQAIQSYAQSYAIVAYLIDEYGSDKMRELLDVFKQGSGYDEAFISVYGFDLDALNTLWQGQPVPA